jgi:hypothetical protein
LGPGALCVGAAIEADLDLGGGADGWVPGVVTKVRLGKGTFRATFRRVEDPAASVLRFAIAGEGGEWRWPSAPDAAAPELAAQAVAAQAVAAPAVAAQAVAAQAVAKVARTPDAVSPPPRSASSVAASLHHRFRPRVPLTPVTGSLAAE